MAKSMLDWHFIDYPKHDDLVLVKTVDDELVLASWDEEQRVWLDAGRDWDWFGTNCVACWAEISGVPETKRPMPKWRKDDIEKTRRLYPEREG